MTTLLLTAVLLGAADRPDIVFADFEGDTYAPWTATGTAFGPGPARGTLPGQMAVAGFKGRGLVNSFHGGDGSTGTLTSPAFAVERKFIVFLIGGGGYAGKTCINLEVNGKVVRTATGPNTQAGGSEELEPGGWDVAEFAGQLAKLVIVDNATGGWGHVNVDRVIFTDAKPRQSQLNPERTLTAERHYLHFPVKTGAKMRKVRINGGAEERFFDIELADGPPDWWAPLDISGDRGKHLRVVVDKLPANSGALTSLEQTDTLKGAESLYREALRPQFHFSPRRGWTNDPNGLVFFQGEYHLFFQHNPYGWNWGNMHWGHAVSKDLVRWTERDDALYPDKFGPMFSGSAVVDHQNTSGLGKDGTAPLVLLYTAAGDPTVQCLASSSDGKAFTKFAGNPIVPQITGGNRDPKVIWHAPTKRWVMTLYVEQDKKHYIHILTSPDLKAWKNESRVEGYYECPDLFALPYDGGTKWVLTAASSEYAVGSFDGTKFTPETPKLPGHRGQGFYAAQTFSDLPNNRRVQIGWLQAPSPGMPFNQAMSVPLELNLRKTKDGPSLTWTPVKELDALRGPTTEVGPLTLEPGGPNPLGKVVEELLDVRATFTPGAATEVTIAVRGVPIVYDVAKQELVVNGKRAPAPLTDGQLDVRILADRTAFEVFAAGGLTYVPVPVIPKTPDRFVRVAVQGGAVKFAQLSAAGLASIWLQP